MSKVFAFHGGVHPPEMKTVSNATPIAAMPLPARLRIAVQQSIGNVPRVLVAAGDAVQKGQMLAAAEGSLSVAVHAPTSGTIVAIDAQPVAHPSGLPDLCITLEPDGADAWGEREHLDWRSLQATAEGTRQIRDYLRDMGVVGLGGAVFPSHLKLAGRNGLETLVINGAECEPYITCDDRMMRERAADIVAGIDIVRSLMGARRVLVGIEDNKPEAIDAMRAALAGRDGCEVVVVPTLYPSGGAKQLIKLLTDIEVPNGVRSTDLGVQCFNVATVYTIYRALEHAEPVLSRVVTLTGNVARPGNVEALIGTPLADLLAFAGEKAGSIGHVYGGPMMGFEVADLAAGLTKAGNCLIAKDAAHFPPKPPEMPCIRCGQCADACPAELQPMDLYWFARARQTGKAQEAHLFDCIECGACAYVCPSAIQLVDYYRFAKSEIWAAEKAKKSADLARERHNFKQLREEREKAEKAARLAARSLNGQATPAAPAKPETIEPEVVAAAPLAAGPEDEKAARIRAAMARAAEKKAQAGNKAAPPNVLGNGKIPGLTPEERAIWLKSVEKQLAERNAVDTSAGNISVEIDSKSGEADTPLSTEEEKAAKIRAAMARAAARRAEQPEQTAGEPAPLLQSASQAAPEPVAAPAMDEEKAARIREAMARAAARRAEKQGTEAVSDQSAKPTAPAPASDEDKAAKIRAAMARVAAKKAAEADQQNNPGSPQAEE